MNPIILSVEEISCGNCTKAIEEHLATITPAVGEVVTDLEKREVRINNPTITLEAAIEALDEIGFTATARKV